MPKISEFFGITIVMYYSDHAPPHFHALYGEYQASIEIQNLKLINGKLPPSAIKLIKKWGQKKQRQTTYQLEKAQEHAKLEPISPLN